MPTYELSGDSDRTDDIPKDMVAPSVNIAVNDDAKKIYLEKTGADSWRMVVEYE